LAARNATFLLLALNLCHAVKQLHDGELDELFEVTFDEAKRRGRLPRRIETDFTPSFRRASDLVMKQSPPTISAERRTMLKSH
jgi:hypothetical protein